jgi:Flp pilus assembly pilin Flp
MKANFESGQGVTEYALILILAVLAVIIILWLFGPAVGKLYSDIYLAI